MKRIILFLLLVSAFGASAATTLYQGPFVVGANLTLTGDTLSASAAAAGWSLTGNAGLTSANFLGSTDTNDLMLVVNGKQAALFQRGTGNNSTNFANIVVGDSSNTNVAGLDLKYANGIAFGRANAVTNSQDSVIVGGNGNTIGFGNARAGIFGGNLNVINPFSDPSINQIIIGGEVNTNNSSVDGVIIGGRNCAIASGVGQVLVWGTRGKGNHPGSVVLADSQTADFATVAQDTFNARFQGGFILSQGTFVMPVTKKITTYTFTTAVPKVTCDTSGGGFTVNLPASPLDGETHWVKKISSDGNTLTLAGNTHNIDGVSTKTTTVQYAGFRVVYYSGSTEWFIEP